jgi:two-component system, sensor histidine kinase
VTGTVTGTQDSYRASLDDRVLVLAASAKASDRLLARLSASAITAERYDQIADLTEALREGAGAIVVLCDQGEPPGGLEVLEDALGRQSEWSQIPVVVLAEQVMASQVQRSCLLPGAMLLTGPLPEEVLEQTLQTALHARRRQYAVRDALDASRKNTRELLEAVRAKDDFLAALAHELRNPLSALGSAAGLLRAEQATPATTQLAAGIVHRQVRHMTRLLDDLLDVTRVALNRLELRKERCRVSNVIRAAVEVIQPLLEAKRHSLIIDLPDPGIEIHADPSRMCQVVSNLLANAAKYTDEEGNIAVRVVREAGEVIISVRDNGRGIPAESLDKVFGMFVQLPGAGGPSLGGLGIGLSLVRGIVALHGGSVRAQSEGLGRGSEFFVHLPDERRSDDLSSARARGDW